MFTLLSKAVSYLWTGSSDEQTEDEISDYLNQQNCDEEETSSEEKYSHAFRGKVTFVNNSENYGLINEEVYFSTDLLSADKLVGVGTSVMVRACKDEHQGFWVAEFVMPIDESWDENERGSSLLLKSKKDNEHAEDMLREEVLVGKITALSADGSGMLNRNRNFFIKENSEVALAPVLGDWVRAKLSPNSDLLSLTPLREKHLEGRITFVAQDGTGFINREVFFHTQACKDGYSPRVGNSVSVHAMESDQGRARWRALVVNPTSSTPKLPNHFRSPSSPTQSSFVNELLRDKEGIKISTSLHFGTLEVGKKKCLKIDISNISDKKHLLKECKIQSGGTAGEQFQLMQRVRDISIQPQDSCPLHVQCTARLLGKSHNLIVFNFDGFTIGRYLTVVVEDQAQQLLKPKSYSDTERTPKMQLQQAVRGQKWIVPGEHPQKFGFKLPVRLPQYPVPKLLWDEVSSASKNSDLHIPLLKQPLCSENYPEKMQVLLHLEEIQLNLEMEKYSLKEAVMYRISNYLALKVPGLKEGRPSLVVGDRVLLHHPVSHENPLYEGFIHEVLKEDILLKFTPSFQLNYNGESYNVSFHFNRTPLRRCHQAVNIASHFSHEVLFPSEIILKPPQLFIISKEQTKQKLQSAKSNKLLNGKSSVRISWYNKLLNDRQKAAVRHILSGECRPSPYIIFGPPGTGKTVTVVEAILQVHTHLTSSRILICTPSNSAADLITERLWESGVLEKNDLARLISYQREQETVNEKIKDVCSGSENLDLVSRKRIVISTMVTVGTLYGLGLPVTHFTHAFIDEAGQAAEPECLIPVGLVAAGGGQIVLAGDPMQLGPILHSPWAKKNGLETSFLERLTGSKVYQRDEAKFSDHGNYDPLVVTKLVNNYRSHPAVLNIYSSMFYHGELICCAPEMIQKKLEHWEELPKSGFPVLFHGVRGCEQQEGNSPSWFNSVETVQVIRYLQCLYEHGLKPDDIGIVTPYRKQVEKINLLISSFQLDPCKIGSVEEFQGQERLAIILSTVRTCREDVVNDNVSCLGFLSNPKRFNVAISRAQALLIVVGDPVLLKMDENWSSLLYYCEENGAYIGYDTEDVQFV